MGSQRSGRAFQPGRWHWRPGWPVPRPTACRRRPRPRPQAVLRQGLGIARPVAATHFIGSTRGGAWVCGSSAGALCACGEAARHDQAPGHWRPMRALGERVLPGPQGLCRCSGVSFMADKVARVPRCTSGPGCWRPASARCSRARTFDGLELVDAFVPAARDRGWGVVQGEAAGSAPGHQGLEEVHAGEQRGSPWGSSEAPGGRWSIVSRECLRVQGRSTWQLLIGQPDPAGGLARPRPLGPDGKGLHRAGLDMQVAPGQGLAAACISLGGAAFVPE